MTRALPPARRRADVNGIGQDDATLAAMDTFIISASESGAAHYKRVKLLDYWSRRRSEFPWERNMSQVAQRRWTFELAEEFGHHDVTGDVEQLVRESGVQTGMVAVGIVGSTGAVTTIEYESGALSDLRSALDRLAPADAHYAHNARWGDGNGFSHVRSALLKTGLSIPVVDGRLQLGTWQQIVVMNLDNRPRGREVVATVVGD